MSLDLIAPVAGFLSVVAVLVLLALVGTPLYRWNHPIHVPKPIPKVGLARLSPVERAILLNVYDGRPLDDGANMWRTFHLAALVQYDCVAFEAGKVVLTEHGRRLAEELVRQATSELVDPKT